MYRNDVDGRVRASQQVNSSIASKSRRLPLTKCTGNAFMGTVAAEGAQLGVVVRVGEESELGRISKAIQGNLSRREDKKSPLQENWVG